MNDKQFERFLLIAAILFVAWYWFTRRRMTPAQPAIPSPGYSGNDPETLTYLNNPGAFGPQTLNGNVNINVSGYNGLNQNYIPLFGFVGMAQGTTWANTAP